MDDSSAISKPETTITTHDVEGSGSSQPSLHKRSLNFWLVFAAICVSVFLPALELTAVSTALPTIVHDLHGDDFVWVGSAYALAATALLPAIGGMAQIFGRRTSMLVSLAMFVLGSALCGSAQNMNWLIAARTLQGAGGGGLLAITNIIVSDLVPLRERALYSSLMGVTWGIAAAMGPVVGGSFAQRGQWRWLFYLNLPLAGVSAILVLFFLNLGTPPGTFREKFSRMDWLGNFLIISSSSAVIIALTWGGVRYPWASVHVLVPLIIGILGIALFFMYEAKFAKNPLIPSVLVSNRTSLSGYIQTFLNPLFTITAVYFLPPYYQACQNALPIRSGVELFGLAIPIGPVLLLTGASITLTKTYRVQIWVAWLFSIAAAVALSTLRADSAISAAIGYPIFMGFSAGILYAALFFPVLAPLPVEENAHALALFQFCRSFAAVWGVSIGTAVLQTQLKKRLPADFLTTVPGGVSLAFALIPAIPTLDEPLRSEVQDAFARSIAVIWQVMIGISGAGLVASLLMKGLPLHTEVDRKWGLQDTISEDVQETKEVRAEDDI